MFRKKKGIRNLHEMMNYYFDGLLIPDNHNSLIVDMAPCFFH